MHHLRTPMLILLVLSISCSAAVGWKDESSAASPAVTRPSGILGKGTRFETPWFRCQSSVRGPKVVVLGGIHGNEPAGAAAAAEIARWSIDCGCVVVVPQCNPPGLKAKIRAIPDSTTDLRDLNRNFPRDGEPPQARGEAAQLLWRFLSDQRPDWVFDLHEGYEFYVSHKPPPGKRRSVGSSVIYFASPQMDLLADRMLAEVNAQVKHADRRFVALRRGPVNGSVARASVKVLHARAMIVETTFKQQPLQLRVDQHLAMMRAAFEHIGVLSAVERPARSTAPRELR